MHQESKNVTLANLGNGVLLELFDAEIKKVMENIRDPNTDAKKARQVTLTVDFVPLSDRSGMKTTVSVQAKLASVPPSPAGTMFILRENGEFHAVWQYSWQEVLPLENVTEMHKAK